MTGPFKRASFKIKRRLKFLTSPPHPLEVIDDNDDDDISDSEIDSVLDLSYNESITSYASTDSTCGCSLLYSPCCSSPLRASPPVVFTSLVTAVTTLSAVTSNKTSSYSQLLRLLDKSTEAVPVPKWRSFLASFISYAIPFPRSADDTVLDAEWPEDAVVLDEELETFSVHIPVELEDVAVVTSRMRNRNFRINSNFLQQYALDCSARTNFSLPKSHSPEELRLLLQRPELRRFDNRHGLHRISTMSKDKLWDSVVLPPRLDSPPSNVIDYASYSYFGNSSGPSVTTKNGNYIPWATHRSSLKPTGELKLVRPFQDKASPTSSPTKAQYTIKGWVNERWVSVL